MGKREPKLKYKKLLFVEGKDEENFFSAFLMHLKIKDMEIQNYDGGRDSRNLKKKMAIVKKIRGFNEVVSVGITKDAEDDYNVTVQSVNDAINATGYHDLGRPVQISTFIIPKGRPTGMLEDLLLESIKDNPAMICVNQYFECLDENKIEYDMQHKSKARLQAYLASRSKLRKHIGEAAFNNCFPFDSPVFNDLKSFLENL